MKGVCLATPWEMRFGSLFSLFLYLQTKACVVPPSTPNAFPHISDWKATAPAGTAIGWIPSGLRPGMRVKSTQAVASIAVPVPT